MNEEDKLLYQSPWLAQLGRSRATQILAGNGKADVAIVGGGIAGICTAFFVLKYTTKSVVLLEGGKIAHGASGHNGGFLATYFERGFADMVREFGLEATAEAQNEIDTSWDLLDEIIHTTALDIPTWRFVGYTACASKQEILFRLEDNELRRRGGVTIEPLLIADHLSWVADLPEKYTGLYSLVPHADILERLETEDKEFIGLIQGRKGCMNSAVFCDALVLWLMEEFPGRFTLAEDSPVEELVLEKGGALLRISGGPHVQTKRVVLCTNGFEYITISNHAGGDINKKFHSWVRGIVGYMAGYIEAASRPPIEISYLPRTTSRAADVYTEEPYFYLTRRPFTVAKEEHSLITLGGPELLLDDTTAYTKQRQYPESARQQFDEFLAHTYKHAPRDKVEYAFLWHGLMGFTPNGIRLIGPEPANPVLLYNLGCNGVGLLPSIYGGRRITRFITGEKVQPLLFDPK